MKRHGFLTIGFVVFVMVGATLARALEMAPLNPAFQHYQAQLRAKTLTTRTADGHALGYRPAPFKLPQPAVSLPAPQGKLQALPASYDLRTYGKVSSVKNQGHYGNCWAFATFGSMESCLLTGESWDFSENNLANLHGFDSAYGAGGNHYMSLAYLTRWSGPVLESADPYSNGPSSPADLPIQKHIQSAQFIPDRTSATDNDAIKQAIITNGGIYSAFYYGGDCYNSANYAYYYGGTSDANHAITIVGWDDAFSRTKFNSTPSGDGAFLIKNSWGAAWGDAGYFWISYYDARIGTDNCLFLNAESTANYESVYQYDPLGFCTAFDPSAIDPLIQYAGFANIFYGSSGTIKAVSFYATTAGATYDVEVYTDVTPGNPSSGTLSARQSGGGWGTSAGYHTVVLDSPVTYSTCFSVVVYLGRYGNASLKCLIPAEYPIADYSSAATASDGESYILVPGYQSGWGIHDWGDAIYNGVFFNVCVKAFGTGGSVGPTPQIYQGQPILTDYDGDRYGDLGLFRRDGSWHLFCSSAGYVEFPSDAVGRQFIVQPGDFDGDRMSDPTVFDTSSGYWYYMSSQDGWSWRSIGPWANVSGSSACGDFDGDRKADPIAYYSGIWDILSSRYGWDGHYYKLSGWGGPGYLPVCADFDGDLYADPMAYEEATGYWYILSSKYIYKKYFKVWFGLPGYTPLSGDFDGDQYADLAIYDKPTGLWAILLSRSVWQNYIYGIWDGSP